VRFVSPPRSSERGCQRGFTLLELTIAMTFVALLASGIVISISTCLNVWKRSAEAADLNQEARAVMEMISRDIHASYMGLGRDAGFFRGFPSQLGEAQIDSLEFTTESSDAWRVSLLPDELRSGRQNSRPPVTDFVGVRYEWGGGQDMPEGFYRTTWVVPGGRAVGGISEGSPSSELVSRALTSLRFRYFDGTQWVASFDAYQGGFRPPFAVFAQLTLRDERGRDHGFQTIVPVAYR